MRGLTLVVAGPDADRLRAALTMACAAAALGARTRIYCHEGAVALLDPAVDAPAPHDGLPALAPLRDLAAESGVAMIACQTGLALAGLSAAAIGVTGGGMIDLLATLDDDRLVVV